MTEVTDPDHQGQGAPVSLWEQGRLHMEPGGCLSVCLARHSTQAEPATPLKRDDDPWRWSGPSHQGEQRWYLRVTGGEGRKHHSGPCRHLPCSDSHTGGRNYPLARPLNEAPGFLEELFPGHTQSGSQHLTGGLWWSLRGAFRTSSREAPATQLGGVQRAQLSHQPCHLCLSCAGWSAGSRAPSGAALVWSLNKSS